MRYMGAPDFKSSDFRTMSREQLAALMATAPPAGSLFQAEDVQHAIENADLLRDDYAEPLVEFALATGPGQKRKLMYVGLGAVAGLAVGALAMKLIGG